MTHRIYAMSFARVYWLYIAKVERKGRTRAEVDEAIRWLTGYSQDAMDDRIERAIDFEQFFAEAPALNPLRDQVTGTICGVRIAEIEEPLMRDIRVLDKLIDDIAKGRPMDKVLRR
jgi:hypothetical protein